MDIRCLLRTFLYGEREKVFCFVVVVCITYDVVVGFC